MPDQLKVDIDALRQFAKAIRTVIGGPDTGGQGMTVDTRISDAMKFIAGLTFGEKVHGFTTAADLAHEYQTNNHNGFLGYQSNQQALVDALSTLATAAEKIAQNYEDAASLDAVSAKMVDETIAESKPSSTSTTSTNPTS
jgi:hypothetical protein